MFLDKLQKVTADVKFDLYGINNVQPIWADHILKQFLMLKWDLT